MSAGDGSEEFWGPPPTPHPRALVRTTSIALTNSPRGWQRNFALSREMKEARQLRKCPRARICHQTWGVDTCCCRWRLRRSDMPACKHAPWRLPQHCHLSSLLLAWLPNVQRSRDAQEAAFWLDELCDVTGIVTHWPFIHWHPFLCLSLRGHLILHRYHKDMAVSTVEWNTVISADMCVCFLCFIVRRLCFLPTQEALVY